MKRASSIAAVAALICVATAARLPMPALAASPSGALTTLEYQQFSKWVTDYEAYGKKQNPRYATAACRALGSSTALLRATHDACQADLMGFRALSVIGLGEETCSQTSSTTTTTGTTTVPSVSGLTSAQLQEYACLAPVYQYASRRFATMHAKDAAARAAGVARSLTGACLNTIVATSRQLRAEKAMSTAEKRTAADAASLVRVESGAAAPGRVDGDTMTADVLAFYRAYRNYSSDGTPNRLSTCPHGVS